MKHNERNILEFVLLVDKMYTKLQTDLNTNLQLPIQKKIKIT